MKHRYSVAACTVTHMSPSLVPAVESAVHSPTSRVQVIWLRPAEKSHDKSHNLVRKFSDSGMDVWLLTASDVPLEQILCFDLIVLESLGYTEADLPGLLQRIRLGSRAPLVLLDKTLSVESRIDALRAGADAILPLTTSSDVILARCMALLRRWRLDGVP